MKSRLVFGALLGVLSFAVTAAATSPPNRYKIEYSWADCLEDPDYDTAGYESYGFVNWGARGEHTEAWCPVTYMRSLRVDGQSTTYKPGSAAYSRLDVNVIDNNTSGGWFYQVHCRLVVTNHEGSDGIFDYEWEEEKSTSGTGLSTLSWWPDNTVSMDAKHMHIWCHLPFKTNTLPPSQIIGYRLYIRP